MKLTNLKVSECYESETNPRGKDFEGKTFDELVASVNEKGVLVPILARVRPHGGKQFEVVAGNRRLRAAKAAGCDLIPAQLADDMSDDEAREAQIVENLQREDVHPLEEGEAYRQLIEDGGKTAKDVALRVGKSDTYVRGRLFLTNLIESAAKKYRHGEFTDGHAVLVARLTPDEQKAAVKYLDGEDGTATVGNLKEWIEDKFYHPLAFQPWMKDEAVAKIVGPCKSCPPNRPSLFGAVKEGQCTDLRCWGNKMAAYIKWRADNDDALVMVSRSYGTPNMKGAVGRSDYTGLGTKKKDHCDFAEQGILVEGPDIGTTIWLCRDEDCKTHRPGHSNSGYATSPKEQAKRKKERELQESARQKFDATIEAAVAKVNFPLSEKHLDALFDIAFDFTSVSFVMPIVRRHGLKADKTKDGRRDYKAPLRRLAEEGGKDGKLRIVFELLLPTYNSFSDASEMKKGIAKL